MAKKLGLIKYIDDFFGARGSDSADDALVINENLSGIDDYEVMISSPIKDPKIKKLRKEIREGFNRVSYVRLSTFEGDVAQGVDAVRESLSRVNICDLFIVIMSSEPGSEIKNPIFKHFEGKYFSEVELDEALKLYKKSNGQKPRIVILAEKKRYEEYEVDNDFEKYFAPYYKDLMNFSAPRLYSTPEEFETEIMATVIQESSRKRLERIKQLKEDIVDLETDKKEASNRVEKLTLEKNGYIKKIEEERQEKLDKADKTDNEITGLRKELSKLNMITLRVATLFLLLGCAVTLLGPYLLSRLNSGVVNATEKLANSIVFGLKQQSSDFNGDDHLLIAAKINLAKSLLPNGFVCDQNDKQPYSSFPSTKSDVRLTIDRDSICSSSHDISFRFHVYGANACEVDLFEEEMIEPMESVFEKAVNVGLRFSDVKSFGFASPEPMATAEGCRRPLANKYRKYISKSSPGAMSESDWVIRTNTQLAYARAAAALSGVEQSVKKVDTQFSISAESTLPAGVFGTWGANLEQRRQVELIFSVARI